MANPKTGIGGFASGLSRGIRTGMEMRRFKREEDEYQYQQDLRAAEQDVTSTMPSTSDLHESYGSRPNAIPTGPQSMSEGQAPNPFTPQGDAVVARQETPMQGLPTSLKPLDRISMQETKIKNSILPYERKQQLLAELQQARIAGFSIMMAGTTAMEDGAEKVAMMNRAGEVLGFPGSEFFYMGEDGTITHNIPFAVDDEGNPLPMDMVMAYLAKQASNPQEAMEYLWETRRDYAAEQEERAHRERMAGLAEREVDAAELSATSMAQYRADMAAIAAEGNELEAAKLRLDWIRTQAQYAGQNPDTVKNILTRMDGLADDYLANLPGDQEFIQNNLLEWRANGDALAVANAGNSRIQAAQLLEATTVLTAASLGKGEIQLDPVITDRGNMVAYREPGGEDIYIPEEMLVDLHRRGIISDEEWQGLSNHIRGVKPEPRKPVHHGLPVPEEVESAAEPAIPSSPLRTLQRWTYER